MCRKTKTDLYKYCKTSFCLQNAYANNFRRIQRHPVRVTEVKPNENMNALILNYPKQTNSLPPLSTLCTWEEKGKWSWHSFFFSEKTSGGTEGKTFRFNQKHNICIYCRTLHTEYQTTVLIDNSPKPTKTATLKCWHSNKTTPWRTRQLVASVTVFCTIRFMSL